VVPDNATSSRATSPAVLARAAAIGSGVGAVAGGVGGTVSFPIVGTFFGALLGVVAGATIGLLNGLVVLAVAELTASRGVTRLACAVTSIGGCLALLAGGLIPGWWPLRGVASAVLLTAIAVLAGALGPIAAHGARPLDLGRRLGEVPVSTYLTKALAAGAVTGGTLGAVAGFVLGLDYLPTAPVAVVEGGILGSVSGAVAAVTIAAVLIAPKLRAR
jgi:hypothetical protein